MTACSAELASRKCTRLSKPRRAAIGGDATLRTFVTLSGIWPVSANTGEGMPQRAMASTGTLPVRSRIAPGKFADRLRDAIEMAPAPLPLAPVRQGNYFAP
jgi:hypothetical protein